jgi:probable F420-dependent oxidoreductase
MNIGVIPINVGIFEPGKVAAIARRAEDAGVESLWTFEHVIVPVDYASKYPYSSTGKMPASPETPFVDPLIAIAHAAAVTTRVRFGTGINILPQANPIYLAKQVASIDLLSNGRMMLGAGAGWLREEYEALGVPFERREDRFDDYIVAIKKLWSGETVEHRSEFLSWSNFKSFPLPVQKPHPPLIIGGTSKRALRRVVEHGNGWYVPNRNVAQLKELLGALRIAADQAGRDVSTIEITASWPDAYNGLSALEPYFELGVSRVMVQTFSLGEADPIAAIDKLGETVLSRMRLQ